MGGEEIDKNVLVLELKRACYGKYKNKSDMGGGRAYGNPV